LIVIAVLFGLAIISIHNKYEKNSLPIGWSFVDILPANNFSGRIITHLKQHLE
jgi:hypothetical protein